MLVYYQSQTRWWKKLFLSPTFLLSCHLCTDAEGSRSDEGKYFMQSRGAWEWKRKRVMESVKLLSESCWSPCCLSYWALGEREREHLCWIEANHMYFICGRSSSESQLVVSYCHTSSSTHLFLDQPVASLYVLCCRLPTSHRFFPSLSILIIWPIIAWLEDRQAVRHGSSVR